MKRQKRNRLSPDEYVLGVLNGDRTVLSRAITLVESALEKDRILAENIIEQVLPHAGKSIRIGITGVPGVGKSTFIESFGKLVTSLSKKLAVLAIDPSSKASKGSILGDKTRMPELSNDPLAYIRPSASGSSVGGVGTKTREAMLLCEASGYEVIFVETIGVGQSETTVHDMADFFLLLMLAGAGDELQGMKKGIMEMADALAINKADGENKKWCELAKREYENALHLFPPSANGWHPPVFTCSSTEQTGLDQIWRGIMDYESAMKANGHFEFNRQQQNVAWMHELINLALSQKFYGNPGTATQIESYEQKVKNGEVPATTAARMLLGDRLGH